MALEHMEQAAPAAPHSVQRANPRVQALRAKGKERARVGLSKLKKLKERVANKAAETLSSRRNLRNGAVLLHSLDSDGADDDDEDHQDALTSSRNHGGGRGSPSRSHRTVEHDSGVRVSVNVAVDVNRSYSCKRDPKTCLCVVCSPRPGLVSTSIWVQGICCPGEVPIIRRYIKKKKHTHTHTNTHTHIICILIIHRILEPLPGVAKVSVSVLTKTVVVWHSSSYGDNNSVEQALVAALNKAHLRAALKKEQVSSSGNNVCVCVCACVCVCVFVEYYLEGSQDPK